MDFEYDLNQKKITFHSNPEQEDVECEFDPTSGKFKFKSNSNSNSNIEPSKTLFRRIFEFIKEWKILIIPVIVFLAKKFKELIPVIPHRVIDISIWAAVVIFIIILCNKLYKKISRLSHK